MGRKGRGKAPQGPLAQVGGVDAVRLRLPAGAGGGTVGEYLLGRYAGTIGAGRVERMLGEGRFVTVDGPVDASTPYEAGMWLWFHRDFAPEPEVPFAVDVVHRDERIVVADKPHFLATTPRGRHITQTALARLRHDLELPALSPAHRLDRLTAGLVLFVVRPADRGAYQTLFRDRRVRKEYAAVAAYDPALALPRTVRNRIAKVHGRLDAFEEPGPANAETRVELLARHGGLAGYRLLPATGRTHQLRLHMSSLGLPLLNDPLYPRILPEADAEAETEEEAGADAEPAADADPDAPADGSGARAIADPDARAHAEPAAPDYSRPLQLLARALEFTDPLTGREMSFTSTRELAAWPREGRAQP